MQKRQSDASLVSQHQRNEIDVRKTVENPVKSTMICPLVLIKAFTRIMTKQLQDAMHSLVLPFVKGGQGHSFHYGRAAGEGLPSPSSTYSSPTSPTLTSLNRYSTLLSEAETLGRGNGILWLQVHLYQGQAGDAPFGMVTKGVILVFYLPSSNAEALQHPE